jgi:tetratricopeptide (TPR) repeat protein
MQCLDALCDIFLDAENYPALEKAAAEAIKLGAALPHPDPLRMARRVHRLGIARHNNGRPGEAVPALEKALALHEEAYGPEAPETAELLGEIGRMFRAQGEHARAQDCLRRCLRISEARFGADSAEAFSDLHQLAASLEESGDLESAAQQYERALALKERKLGHENLDELAGMQFSLAGLHIGWSSYSRARELLAECIGTFRRTGGPRLAVAYETLAQVEEVSGRYDGALKELENAGKVWEKCGAERHPELVRNLEYRADILDQLRRKRESGWLRERAAALSGQGEAPAGEKLSARSAAGD